jgi:geranylgeranyl diphosphate synthase type II
MEKIFDFYSKYQSLKRLVDEKLRLYRDSEQPLLDGLIKSIYYSLDDGKRFRAIFTFLLGELYDIPENKLLNSACALEMVHTASLIMGDLPYMDDSQLRRGKPANHIVFGQDVALCSCITLLSDANQMVLADERLSAEERGSILDVISQAYGINGLTAGEYVDMKLRRKNIDFSIIEFITRKKTAALFTAAAKIVAIISNAPNDERTALEKFAENVSFSFRVKEDIVENNKNEAVSASEEKENINFVKLLGYDKAVEYAKKYGQAAAASLELFGEKNKPLLSFVDALLLKI